jgi:hypothetical protein
VKTIPRIVLQFGIPIGLAVLAFTVYSLTRGWTHHQYFINLADAFLHGRLYITDPPSYLDELVRIGERYYVIYPPMPAVLLLPVVAVFGIGLETQVWVFLTLAAACCVPLAWLVGRRLDLGAEPSVWLAVLLGFGTTFWYTGVEGSAWYTAHIAAVFFLLLAVLEALGRKRPALIGFMLGLAALSRLTTVLSLPFFLLIVWERKGLHAALRRWVWIGLGLAVPLSMLFLYNYARYQDPFTMGYHLIPYLLEEKTGLYAQTYKYGAVFDMRYLPRHIYAIFFQPPIYVDRWPYFLPSWLGMGLFMTTPAFLYAFAAGWEPVARAAVLAILLISIPIVTHGGIGDTQFGYRFSLDVTPFLLILVGRAFQRSFGWRERAVVLLSVLINVWGVLSINIFHTVRY